MAAKTAKGEGVPGIVTSGKEGFSISAKGSILRLSLVFVDFLHFLHFFFSFLQRIDTIRKTQKQCFPNETKYLRGHKKKIRAFEAQLIYYSDSTSFH